MLDWQERTAALPPAGVVASGGCVRALLLVLQGRASDRLRGLSMAATRDFLVILGEAAELPWADGVRYCAPDPHVPGLWLPTHMEPALPTELVHGALHRRAPFSRLLLWHAPERVIPLDSAADITPASLAWLGQELDG